MLLLVIKSFVFGLVQLVLQCFLISSLWITSPSSLVPTADVNLYPFINQTVWIQFTHDSVLRSHTDQTHVGRCWGLWRLSLDVGSKRVCTAHSCVRPCCEDSCHKLLRWRFLKPRTRPCQSDTSPSAGYSYTLQTPRKQNGGDSVSQHKIWQLFHLQQLVQIKVIMIDYWFTWINKNWTWISSQNLRYQFSNQVKSSQFYSTRISWHFTCRVGIYPTAVKSFKLVPLQQRPVETGFVLVVFQ